ncbi:MAG: hypothetical protein ACRD26_05705, partial [Vicinamibacterales bacterium]
MTRIRAGWLGRWLGHGAAADAAMAELAASVRELAALQRKQAEQLKKIRESQAEMDARWQSAVDRWQALAGEAELRQARETRKSQEKTVERLDEIRRDADDHHKAQQKWRVIFSRQVDAMMRALQLGRLDLPHPFDLTARRFRLRSQNEEDGIILALLEAAGVRDRRFVEIGCGRTGGNAALLAYECGWTGLMVDANAPAIDIIRRRFHHNPGVVAVASEVSAANVNDLLAAHGFTGDVDLFSLDIDSHDYWVLEALEACSPRVLVLEYNAAFGPDRALTVPRGQSLLGAPSWYRGASLAALERLARRKGYRLVACENSGVNAFF